MIRAVLDTNIVVSALLQPLGQPARVFLLALAGAMQLCGSGEIYAEYEDVLRRPRLNHSENQIEGTKIPTNRRESYARSQAAMWSVTQFGSAVSSPWPAPCAITSSACGMRLFKM